MAVRLSNANKLNLISNLATMLQAGIPLMESIDTLLEEVKGDQKKVLTVLKEDINQGKKISQSFARFPDAFDPVTIHLIGAAEESGTLDTTLKDLIVTIKKDMEFNDKVKSAMIYPSFVFCVFVAVVLVILIFVVPRIGDVFLNMHVVLPLPTLVLIWTSRFLLSHVLQVVLGTLAIGASIFFIYRAKKKFFMNLLFSLPGFSDLAKEIDLTRFTRSFGLLLVSGIPISNALELSGEVITRRDLHQMVQDAKATVASGKKLSDTFKAYKSKLPGMMIRITQAGEKSGALAKSMQDVSEYFDDSVSKKIKTFVTLLEPAMLLLIGVAVGGMLMAVIAPIYSLIGSINVH